MLSAPPAPLASRRRRWLVAASVLLTPAALFLVVRSAPRLPDGLVPPPGRYDVEILRDAWGVPHVFGTRDADTAYGLAWAHSEDDFATIQGALLAARGELAAAFGRDLAPNDYMVALLRIQDVVARGYPTLPADVRAICEAYAEGVNHYAATHAEEAVSHLYPVRGADVVAGFVHKVPLFFGLDKALGALFSEPPRPASRAAARNVVDPDAIMGSNVFAVAPSRTTDGGTYLAINSHQPWTGPVAWYEAHLHSDEGWDMVGGTFPGAPVVLHGHNRHLGWAHTVNTPDLLDVYALTTDDDKAPERYRLDGNWLPLERRTVPISVKLFGPLRVTVTRDAWWSRHGPAVVRPHGTFALRLAGYGDVGQIEQWFRMNKARTFEQWRTAMQQLSVPMFNTGYADATGRLHYVYNARLPPRRPGYDYTTDLPGDTSDTLWPLDRTVPYGRLPQLTDPASGFFVNANHSPFRATIGPDNPDPSTVTAHHGVERRMTNRALRLLSLLDQSPRIDWTDFVRIKFDTRYDQRSVMARIVERVLTLADEPSIAAAQTVLGRWNFDTTADNRQAALAVLAFGRHHEHQGPLPDDATLVANLEEAVATLERHHGGLDVPWGNVNRLRRGTVDLPLAGGPDVVHAIYGTPSDDGRLVGRSGDSYVLMVGWGPDRTVRSQSLHQFGSATLDQTSPHYADQAPLLAERRLKDVLLDEADLRARATRAYRPGASRNP